MLKIRETFLKHLNSWQITINNKVNLTYKVSGDWDVF